MSLIRRVSQVCRIRQAFYIADGFGCSWRFVSSHPLVRSPIAVPTLHQCVPTCCVILTIERGDSHGHSVALGRSPDTRWEPIDWCCHLSFNTVKWMTHCHHSMQSATQPSYCPCVAPALVRSTRAFASDFPQNAGHFPPYAGRRTVRPPRCPLLSEPCGTAGTHLFRSKRQALLIHRHGVTSHIFQSRILRLPL